MLAVKTAVGIEGILHGNRVALWAGAALFVPVAVAIEAVLDMLGVYGEVVVVGQTVGLNPGISLHAYKLHVAAVMLVLK